MCLLPKFEAVQVAHSNKGRVAGADAGLRESLGCFEAAGTEYPMMGLYQMKYIFEVPEDAQDLVLVAKGSERVPLP